MKFTWDFFDHAQQAGVAVEDGTFRSACKLKIPEGIGYKDKVDLLNSVIGCVNQLVENVEDEK